MEQDLKTEEVIFLAAREVFLEKGLDGARMQEIAERANINKALLHYYYRSKEKLFDMVLQQVIKLFFSQIIGIWDKDISFEEKIRAFVENYINVLVKNPFIPRFMLNTLSRYPDKIDQILNEKTGGMFSQVKDKVQIIQEQIDAEVIKGNFRPINAKDLMINMLSLLIFPIVGSPIIKYVFNFNQSDYDLFINERKKTVVEFVLLSLKNK